MTDDRAYFDSIQPKAPPTAAAELVIAGPTESSKRETHRCARCFYVIDHLGQTGLCPECGVPFDLRDARTFTVRPPFVGWKFWLPGFVTAFLVGLALFLALIWKFGFTGSTTLAVSLSAGVLMGYRTRLSSFVAKILLGIVLAVSFVIGLKTASFVGVFCGLVFGCIALGPILAGIFVGSTLRMILKSSTFSMRGYLPVLVLAFPIICAIIEGRHDHMAPVSLTTSTTIHAHLDDAWNSIQFYEQVKHTPPWLLRLTPSFRPLYTTGNSSKVGDVKICVYERGRLVKQITEIVPGRRLAFRVIEQTEIENNSVRLIGGSFDLQPSADGESTIVTLTTQYQPLLTPRFAFLPAEKLAVHELHGHVLAGMRMDAEERGRSR